MAASAHQQDTKWADGLRGLAACLVVNSHITRSVAPYLTRPRLEENGGTLLFQLPIVRTFFMGRPSVAAFALLAGFVNSLKPIRQAKLGQIDACLSGVAKSAYRRTGRFILPSMTATIISWLLCQFEAYHLGTTVSSDWIRDTSPRPSISFVGAFTDLFGALLGTWTHGANDYDKIQWTLTFLLRGSMMVYLSLIATAYVQPLYRFGIYLMLYMFFWAAGDDLIAINVYMGLMMTELHHSSEVMQYVENRPGFAVLSSTLIFTGFLCNSYPEDSPEWAPWSAAMGTLGHYIFPRGSELARFFPSIGGQMVCLGVMFNHTAKRLLSSRLPCFMGRHSFAVYLIHAPLIRIVLAWMLFGLSVRPPSPGQDEQGNALGRPYTPLTSKWNLVIGIPIFYWIVYRCAMLWTAYVDPFCGRITNWIEVRMFRPGEAAEKPVAQVQVLPTHQQV